MSADPSPTPVPRRSWLGVCGAVALSACGLPAAGGFVPGAPDTHCAQPDGGVRAQPTSMASCQLAAADGGVAELGAPLFNAEGDDDDCKYHLTVRSTAVTRSAPVTFTLVGTDKAGGGPMTGAETALEALRSDTHPAPNAGTTTAEGPAGTYTVGPVAFDGPGRWTLRFHFFHRCTDAAEDSPHGHVAFSLDVP